MHFKYTWTFVSRPLETYWNILKQKSPLSDQVFIFLLMIRKLHDIYQVMLPSEIWQYLAHMTKCLFFKYTPTWIYPTNKSNIVFLGKVRIGWKVWQLYFKTFRWTHSMQSHTYTHVSHVNNFNWTWGVFWPIRERWTLSHSIKFSLIIFWKPKYQPSAISMKTEKDDCCHLNWMKKL